jgi:YD repeat-containing protein
LAYACNTDPCNGVSAYEQLFGDYDSYGRLTQNKLKLNNVDYIYDFTYNSNGQIATVRYPSGVVLEYIYNTYGYLSQIENNSSHVVYWTANARDAELHLLQATAGNGVVTNQSFNAETGTLAAICATPDSGSCDGATANFSYQWDTIRLRSSSFGGQVGNLTDRADTYESYTEYFCYDSLNRLTNYASARPAPRQAPAIRPRPSAMTRWVTLPPNPMWAPIPIPRPARVRCSRMRCRALRERSTAWSIPPSPTTLTAT